MQYLEALGEDGRDVQKSEYSLTQHLANNLMDMYINLPSRNHYRHPASYASKGYRTRRMAVDFAIPLITNVKVAKILAEALVRKMPLTVSIPTRRRLTSRAPSLASSTLLCLCPVWRRLGATTLRRRARLH